MVMASPTNVQPLHGGNGEPDGNERLGQAIGLVQARIDEEMQISERISAKGRQLFALISAFFAVAQTLALGGLGIPQVAGTAKVLVVVLGALAAGALLVCGHQVANLEELSSEWFVKPDMLLQWAQDGNDRTFARQALVHMAGVATARRAGNEKRAEKYKGLELWARVALILIAAEILIALIFRA
jgi:hypothetical protein